MGDGVGDVIGNILDTIGSGFSRAIRSIYNAITSVWSVSTDFWWRVALKQFDLVDVFDRIKHLGNWFTGNVRNCLWWLIHDFVPRMIRYAVDRISSWVSAVVNDIRSTLSRLINDVISWVTRIINDIRNIIDRVISWAQREISQLWHDLTATIRIVQHFLTNPSILVEWIWDALWTRVWQWVRSHEEWIARWLLANAIRGALSFAHLVEDMIVRIL